MNVEPDARRVILVVVDDDTVFSLLASETLQQAGYTAHVAATGREALALLGAEMPDLVLLDVELPDAKRIRAVHADSYPARRRGYPDRDGDRPQRHRVHRTRLQSGRDRLPSTSRCCGRRCPSASNSSCARRITCARSRSANRRTVRCCRRCPTRSTSWTATAFLLEHITSEDSAADSSLVGKTLEDVIPADAARAARRSMTAPIDVKSRYDLRLRGWTGRGTRCLRNAPAPAIGRHAGRHHPRYHRAARTESRIKYLAYFDTLTGLPNRQLLVREMSRAIRAAQKNNHPDRTAVPGSGSLQAYHTTTSVTRSATSCSNQSRAGCIRASATSDVVSATPGRADAEPPQRRAPRRRRNSWCS